MEQCNRNYKKTKVYPQAYLSEKLPVEIINRKYCLNVINETQMIPVLWLINSSGFSSKHFKEENVLWAKKIMACNKKSICDQ